MSAANIEQSDRHFDWAAGGGTESVEIARGENGDVTITVENPGAGDTESGFGQTCHVTIPADVALALGAWLVK